MSGRYKIRVYDLTMREWDEDIIEADNLKEAEAEAKQWWFDINEMSYTAEELEK